MSHYFVADGLDIITPSSSFSRNYLRFYTITYTKGDYENTIKSSPVNLIDNGINHSRLLFNIFFSI